MVNITEEFKKLWDKKVPDASLLVPLMNWVSGSESNIEAVQKINRKMNVGNQNIYILELTYNTNIRHFLKYPKIEKLKDEEKQYRRDFAKFFGWSQRELIKNLNVVDLEGSKEEISNLFGYDDVERKRIGLKKRSRK